MIRSVGKRFSPYQAVSPTDAPLATPLIGPFDFGNMAASGIDNQVRPADRPGEVAALLTDGVSA
jgi:hypothetical protein